MENFNTKLSSESVRNVNALIQKIEGVCKNIEKNLAMCLELNGDSVAQYSVTTAEKVESEFVDRIVLNIDKIKNHLRDLKKALSQKVISDMTTVTTIIGSLQETSDTLQTFLLSNNFFNNTFQLPVMEIQAAIDQIFEEVSMVEYANA
jgi:tRNA A58 N-methylase Trm61